MDVLKSLPLRYRGELHDVKLINFSVDLDEVRHLVPEPIKIRTFDGKAIISMVNVKLRKMRPGFVPAALGFKYQHIGFRLLVDDSAQNEGGHKGIFFLRSFGSNPVVVWAGGMLTDYRLKRAEVDEADGFNLRRGDQFLHYELTNAPVQNQDASLKSMIQAIDRAYAVRGERLVKTQIVREKWPVESVTCANFSTNFFSTAKFLGAFEVKEVIDYDWLPAEKV